MPWSHSDWNDWSGDWGRSSAHSSRPSNGGSWGSGQRHNDENRREGTSHQHDDTARDAERHDLARRNEELSQENLDARGEVRRKDEEISLLTSQLEAKCAELSQLAAKLDLAQIAAGAAEKRYADTYQKLTAAESQLESKDARIEMLLSALHNRSRPPVQGTNMSSAAAENQQERTQQNQTTSTTAIQDVPCNDAPPARADNLKSVVVAFAEFAAFGAKACCDGGTPSANCALCVNASIHAIPVSQRELDRAKFDALRDFFYEHHTLTDFSTFADKGDGYLSYQMDEMRRMPNNAAMFAFAHGYGDSSQGPCYSANFCMVCNRSCDGDHYKSNPHKEALGYYAPLCTERCGIEGFFDDRFPFSKSTTFQIPYKTLQRGLCFSTGSKNADEHRTFAGFMILSTELLAHYQHKVCV